MTSAIALSASEHAAVRPVSYDVIPGQTSSGRANSMPILRYADSSWADGPSTVRRPDQNSGQAHSSACDVRRTSILG